MSIQEIADAAMALPEKEHLKLARWIVASVGAERAASCNVADAIRGIEDIVTGKVAGLSEAEFRNEANVYRKMVGF